MSRQRLITLAVVLAITFVVGTAYGHTGAIPDVVRLLVIVGPVAAWLAELIRTRHAFPRTALDAPLAALAVWVVAAALFAQDRRISLEMIWPFLAHILLFYLLVDLMRRGWADHVKVALLAAALVVVALSGIELAAWYFGWMGQPGWFPVEGLADPVPPEFEPLNLALNVSTIEGNYLTMLIPLVIAGAVAVRRRAGRLALATLAAILLGLELLTFSRGGLLGALAATGILFVFSVLRWQRRSGRMGSLLRPETVLGGLVIAVLGASLLIVVWSARASRADSDRGRLDTWRSALAMVRDDPLTGVGPGVFGLALRSYRDPEIAQDRLVSAHDLPLHLLAEMGAPGLLLVAWLALRFGRQWWRAWQAADPARRIWLEGGIAALVAYGTHSLVDVFPLTSSVLPLLIIAAYTAADPSPEPRPARSSQRLAWTALAGIAVFSIWIATLDVAQGWMTLSRRSLDRGDLAAALDQAEKARAWDPSLSLYDLHQAYVLGLLANTQPDAYLDRAIAAHEAALAQQPTFDMGWANLAALYRQRGDDDAARIALQRAAAILPADAIYWLKLGDTVRALDEDPDLAAVMPHIDPDGLATFLRDEEIPAAERLYAAVLAGAKDDAGRLVPDAADEGGWLADLALGLYAHRMTGDDATALDYLARALQAHPQDERPALERAEIELAQGDFDAAGRDARYALFVDPHGGAPGNYVLARIAAQQGAGDDAIERLLKDSIALRPAVQYFAGTVYARPASFRLLPQLGALRTSFRAYDGGLALADFYRERGQIDAARQVYHMLLYENPYLVEAEAALAVLPDAPEQEETP